MTARKLASLPVLAAILTACSGADNQDLFEPGAQQNDTATTPPASPSGGASQSSDPTEPTSGGSGSGSASAPSASSDPPPPPPPAAPMCPQESEPNGTLKTATLFTSSLCGKIDGHSDVDYAKVVAPDGAKRITYTVTSSDGKVAYRLYADGFPILFDPGELPVSAGTTYSFELEGSGGSKPTWEVDVTFD